MAAIDGPDARAPSVLVVGRDAAFCGRLATLLRALRQRLPLHLLPAAPSAELARQAGAPDVALLDLGLPDAYALAQAWARLPRGPRLILILPSSDSQPQLAALGAADTLLAPVRADRLEAALRRALAHGRSAPEGLAAWGKDGTRAVPLDEVIYLRAGGKYVSIRTGRGEFLSDRPLAEWLERFPGHFVQVHRHTLVARAAIAAVRRVTPEQTGGDADPYWELALHGAPERIAVARRRWPAVRQCLPILHPSLPEAS